MPDFSRNEMEVYNKAIECAINCINERKARYDSMRLGFDETTIDEATRRYLAGYTMLSAVCESLMIDLEMLTIKEDEEC